MQFKLLAHKELTDFPSGSALEFYKDRLYIVGDDARQLLVLNKKWKEVERIKMFDHPEYRIPKDEKADLEASTMIKNEDHPKLLLLGSGSFENKRNKSFLIDVKSNATEEKDLSTFYERLRKAGIPELNIEAAAVVNDFVLLCNRGNLKHPLNHFIITKTNFADDQKNVRVYVIPFELPVEKPAVAGISGITYSSANDWLIFTASTEVTESAYKDGEIGESYIGVIENAEDKMNAAEVAIGSASLKVSHFIPLSSIHAAFIGKKIESLSMEKDKRKKLTLHLVADNDSGVSFLFKLALKN